MITNEPIIYGVSQKPLPVEGFIPIELRIKPSKVVITMLKAIPKAILYSISSSSSSSFLSGNNA
jgi:hypothetical protein